MSQLTSASQVQPQDLFTSATTAQTVVGTYAVTPDGRGFRYTKAGATVLIPGKLYQSSAQDTSNLQNLAVAATAIGALSVTTTTTVTLTANQVAGGYLSVTTAAGSGYIYRIAGHAAATAAAVTFNLEDPIQVALTTSSRIDVTPDPYDSVIVNPATASSSPAGVAIYPIPASSFGWLQTHGITNVLANGTVTAGYAIAASVTVAGAVSNLIQTSGTTSVVGMAVTGIADTEYGSVFLTID